MIGPQAAEGERHLVLARPANGPAAFHTIIGRGGLAAPSAARSLICSGVHPLALVGGTVARGRSPSPARDVDSRLAGDDDEGRARGGGGAAR
jgi:hypothetical protein